MWSVSVWFLTRLWYASVGLCFEGKTEARVRFRNETVPGSGSLWGRMKEDELNGRYLFSVVNIGFVSDETSLFIFFPVDKDAPVSSFFCLHIGSLPPRFLIRPRLHEFHSHPQYLTGGSERAKQTETPGKLLYPLALAEFAPLCIVSLHHRKGAQMPCLCTHWVGLTLQQILPTREIRLPTCNHDFTTTANPPILLPERAIWSRKAAFMVASHHGPHRSSLSKPARLSCELSGAHGGGSWTVQNPSVKTFFRNILFYVILRIFSASIWDITLRFFHDTVILVYIFQRFRKILHRSEFTFTFFRFFCSDQICQEVTRCHWKYHYIAHIRGSEAMEGFKRYLNSRNIRFSALLAELLIHCSLIIPLPPSCLVSNERSTTREPSWPEITQC